MNLQEFHQEQRFWLCSFAKAKILKTSLDLSTSYYFCKFLILINKINLIKN